MKKSLIAVLVVGAALGVHVFSGRPSADAATLTAGDLIRGTTFSAVYYYGKDGFRYVFPNEKTYFTWYNDFSNVRVISDAQLGEIQIGGNITYRPGVKMVKIMSDNKTYAVGENGILRHVTSEQVARDLYGTNWNKQIDDVPDAFFANYTVGDAINNSSDFSRSSITASASTINNDKGLQAPVTITVSETGYSPASITISPGRVVKFVNGGTGNHTVSADDLTWGSGTMNAGKSFSRRFTKTGPQTFFDSYNSQFTGTIIVQ
jgi:plastocyanin